ncbi:hypothetical protein P7K49_011111 [Saguinus oedipus]|uniref:Dehydrogenase/reductase SDR family member 11 n=1 Tax=Saguinus oedipus TaxID=9490 RepID=A0ABQ9VPQ4_SAGOE|nr:hypothetical protein P7K49_011111 [Saguinus oedipus]
MRPRGWRKPPLNLSFPAPEEKRSRVKQRSPVSLRRDRAEGAGPFCGRGRGRGGDLLQWAGRPGRGCLRLNAAGCRGLEGRDAGVRGAGRTRLERPGVTSSTPASGRRGPMAGRGMERWRDRLALVTGASVGIGAAVARALVQQGLKVVGCARTVGNIEVRPGQAGGGDVAGGSFPRSRGLLL